MRHRLPALAVTVLLAVLGAACGASQGTDDAVAGAAGGDGSGEVALGAEVFATSCAVCHGSAAEGTAQGPSFLSDIYVPSHHDDESFRRAVRSGVQPHHWDFGPMPPIGGLDDADVEAVIAWVRQLQREAGLID